MLYMEKEQLPDTPEEFYPESNDKDELLQNLFMESTAYRLACPECKNKSYSKKIWISHIEPWLEFTKKQDDHPLDQMETWKELFYLECPNCGEKTMMKGGTMQ